MKALFGILLAAAMPFVIAGALHTKTGSLVLAVVVFGAIVITILGNIVMSFCVSFSLGEWAFRKSGNS